MTTNDLGASVRLDHQLLAVESEHRVHCLLELTAPETPAAERRPLHLALVIDRSGSMQGDKLETAKASAAYLARRLAPTDRLAVVTYNDEVRLELPLTEVGHDQHQLEQALHRIQPGGMTNLSGGWLKGVEQLRAVPGGIGPKKVLLLTDGLANRGVTEPDPRLRWRAACDEGVGTTTIGFGEGFDEELLTRIADVAAGNAYFAGTPEEAPGIFAQEFEGLTALVAQNLSVEVRHTADVQMLGVLNEYPVVPVPGGLQAQLGDAYAEERRRVVFELAVSRLETLGVVPVAEVVVRYVSLGDRIEAHELHLPITVNAVSADEAAQAATNDGVVEEIVVLKSARAQREARERAEEGDFDTAQKLLREAAEDLRQVAPGSPGTEELLTQADETARFAESMSEPAYDETTKKTSATARGSASAAASATENEEASIHAPTRETVRSRRPRRDPDVRSVHRPEAAAEARLQRRGAARRQGGRLRALVPLRPLHTALRPVLVGTGAAHRRYRDVPRVREQRQLPSPRDASQRIARLPGQRGS